MYEKIRFVKLKLIILSFINQVNFFNRYQQQAYAAYGQAAAASFYPELYNRPGSASYMSLPPYSVSTDWHPPVSEYRRDYERRPRNNS